MLKAAKLRTQRSGPQLKRRSKGAQTKNPAARFELPDFERSGLRSDTVVPVAGLEPARLAALDFESFAPHGTQTNSAPLRRSLTDTKKPYQYYCF